MVEVLAPKIIRLRSESNQPITVYIESPGGVVASYQTIVDLLFSPDLDGQICRVITVGVGYVASAAAALLCRGDYVLCYPNCVIHCHGTRIRGVEVTKERAEAISGGLLQLNRGMAGSFLQKASELLPWLHCFYREQKFEDLSDLIGKNLSPKNKSIIDETCEKVNYFDELDAYLHAEKKGQNLGDVELLQHIFNFVIAKSSDKSNDEILSLTREFLWLTKEEEHGFGSKSDMYSTLELICSDQALQSSAEENDPEKARKILREDAFASYFRLWKMAFFTGWRLVEGENELTSRDAYWLGLVDEIIGTNLQNRRLLVESSNA